MIFLLNESLIFNTHNGIILYSFKLLFEYSSWIIECLKIIKKTNKNNEDLLDLLRLKKWNLTQAYLHYFEMNSDITIQLKLLHHASCIIAIHKIHIYLH